MEGLLYSQQLSDVTLVVGAAAKRIPAHRHILATHSCVFERMWAHNGLQEVCVLLALTDARTFAMIRRNEIGLRWPVQVSDLRRHPGCQCQCWPLTA